MVVDVPIDHAIPPQRDCARYKMHKYWAGKPWYVVSEYIRHFTKEGEIVLDPFCGGGVVGCEALINRRKAVLNDLNPMAVFITKNTCLSPVDLDLFSMEFERIRGRLKNEIMEMYRLRDKCPLCGSDLYAKHVVRGPALNGRWIVEARCPKGHGRNARLRRLLTPEEIADIEKIETRRIPFWYPDDEFPDGREIMRLKNAGITRVHQLFTKRNLWALSAIFHEIQEIRDAVVKDMMLLAFTNTILHVSKLKSEDLRPMSANSYYCMGDWIEENVWVRFENRVMWRWGVHEGKKETNRLIGSFYNPVQDFAGLCEEGTFMLSNGAAQDLSGIPDESIDYCFTDPPYGGSIQYGELTLLWRSWLRMGNGFVKDEIIVNDFQNKKEQDFEKMLKEAFCEIYRVLKPGRWLSVTFNNRDQRIWMALLDACRAAGFEKVNIVPQKPLGNSFVQSWTGYSLKRDLILNFRKPLKTAIFRNEKFPSREKIDKGVSVNASTISSRRIEKLGDSDISRKFEVKDIIISAAREYMAKNRKATLPELFEAAIIKWIDITYGQVEIDAGQKGNTGCPDDKCSKSGCYEDRDSRTACDCRELSEEAAFDMAIVDRYLQQEPAFQRMEENKNIIYLLDME
ncbi:MAG TPA: hypothetical protein GXX35_03765 [Thermoanaerobacterales bacterium]|nr:hypothetical protein [Thermoanaerobacterales bacterium]